MKYVLLVDCDRQVLTARGDELAADAFEPMLAASAPAARVKLPDAEVLILGRLESVSAGFGAGAGSARRSHRRGRSWVGGGDDRRGPRPRAGAPLPGRRRPRPAQRRLAAAGQRRRARAGRPPRPGAGLHPVWVGNLTIGLDNGTAMVADRPLALSNREFDVLCALARDPAVVVSKQQLLKDVWQGYSNSRAPDTMVRRLRDRLHAGGARVTVKTHRGRGWQLTPGARSDPIAAAFPHPPVTTPPDHSSTATPRPTVPARSRSLKR